MRDAFNFQDLTRLASPSLFNVMPEKAVTFVGNHDTEARQDNDLDFPNAYEAHAYAYILMAPGYPTIFYSHYETSGDEQREKIQQLISLRQQLAAGEWAVLYSSTDQFIVSRAGDDTKNGLVLYLNISDSEVSREVQTLWSDATLEDFTDGIIPSTNTDTEGMASLSAPANGYAIWSIQN